MSLKKLTLACLTIIAEEHKLKSERKKTNSKSLTSWYFSMSLVIAYMLVKPI